MTLRMPLVFLVGSVWLGVACRSSLACGPRSNFAVPARKLEGRCGSEPAPRRLRALDYQATFVLGRKKTAAVDMQVLNVPQLA